MAQQVTAVVVMVGRIRPCPSTGLAGHCHDEGGGLDDGGMEEGEKEKEKNILKINTNLCLFK